MTTQWHLLSIRLVWMPYLARRTRRLANVTCPEMSRHGCAHDSSRARREMHISQPARSGKWRAVKRALVVVDMPFGTYQGNSKLALASAIRIMKETGADCLKLEGGEEILDSVKRILSAGIPIIGHLGLTPQSINKFGTYTVRAREEEEAKRLISDAHLLEEAGCSAIVLEKIPATLAAQVASELKIPIIGIGAGNGVDGQVLVIHDMLGMTNGFSPRFLRRYADLYTTMSGAVQQYVNDVKSGDFPNEKEQY